MFSNSYLVVVVVVRKIYDKHIHFIQNYTNIKNKIMLLILLCENSELDNTYSTQYLTAYIYIYAELDNVRDK